MGNEIQKLTTYATPVVGLALVSVIGMIVLETFKDSGTYSTTVNDSIDLFITGLKYFATFLGVVVITIIGKMVIALVKSKDWINNFFIFFLK